LSHRKKESSSVKLKAFRHISGGLKEKRSRTPVLVYSFYHELNKVAGLNEKAQLAIGLLLAAVGAIRFGFSTLLLFGQLFETLATTLGDLPKVIVFYVKFTPTFRCPLL